jgi:glutamyl/glutaminyl-tRNA synthetase
MDELTKAFDISRIGHSGAQMNLEKLDWINKEHIKKLSEGELKNNIFEYLPDDLKIEKIIPLIAERISKWGDIKEMVDRGDLDFFYKRPTYEKNKLVYKTTSLEKISNNLKQAINALEILKEKDFNQENIKNALMLVANKLENRGELLHPVRYALSGLDKSPDPFIIAEILGKNETLSRLQKAI